jgi:CRP-like cAMP-binding protein
MSPTGTLAALRGSRLAKELSEEELRIFAESVELRELPDREVLVREGSSDDRLYVIVDGALDVVKGAGAEHATTLVSLGKGDLVGELSFIDGTPHYASIVAVKPTQVLALQRARLEALVTTHPRIVYGVMRAIVRIVHEIQRRISMQTSELVKYIYKQGGRY